MQLSASADFLIAYKLSDDRSIDEFEFSQQMKQIKQLRCREAIKPSAHGNLTNQIEWSSTRSTQNGFHSRNSFGTAFQKHIHLFHGQSIQKWKLTITFVRAGSRNTRLYGQPMQFQPYISGGLHRKQTHDSEADTHLPQIYHESWIWVASSTMCTPSMKPIGIFCLECHKQA